MAAYKEENPDYEVQVVKSILNKEEKALYDKSVGKPEKPPNSGYSLFSRIMLSSEEIKHINHKDRMMQISSMWKNLSLKDKRKYADKVQQVGSIFVHLVFSAGPNKITHFQMLEQYKLDFATYLESLPPGKRQEELLSNTVRRKPDGVGITKKKVPEKAKAPVKSVSTEVAANSKVKASSLSLLFGNLMIMTFLYRKQFPNLPASNQTASSCSRESQKLHLRKHTRDKFIKIYLTRFVVQGTIQIVFERFPRER